VGVVALPRDKERVAQRLVLILIGFCLVIPVPVPGQYPNSDLVMQAIRIRSSRQVIIGDLFVPSVFFFAFSEEVE
jgi:hypothetical protein